MKYINVIKYLFPFVITFSVFSIDAVSQSLPKDDPLYELVFYDEFDEITLNTSKWRTSWEWSPANMFNNNVTSNCYRTDRDSMQVAYLRGAPFNQGNWEFNTTGTGFVRMIYKREDFIGKVFNYQTTPVSDLWIPFKYSGAMMKSKYYFKYGYFEIKYRTTNQYGDISNSSPKNAYGPNFWMWNSDTSSNPLNPTRVGAYYSELDIYEIRGTDWMSDANIHYRKYPNKDKDGNYIPPPTGNPADTVFFHAKSWSTPVTVYDPPYLDIETTKVLPNDWHIMGCDWSKNYVDFYYDAPNFHRRFHDTITKVSELIEMPIIIDNYMPAFQYCIWFDSLLTKQPFYYDIDYVRVYQVKQEYVNKSLLNSSSNSFESKVYKSLTLGGFGGNAVFTNDKHHFCAEEYVLLQEGVEISGSNTEVSISCRPYQHDQWIEQRNAKSPSEEYNPNIINDLIKAKTICE